MAFELRPASAADWDFIWDLRVRTMKALIVHAYGWDEETQRSYAAESLKGEVVLVDGQPVGVLTLSDWGDQLHITWMAISPPFQRHGLGSALVAHCQRRAASAGRALTLQVLQDSPAVRLYQRCGFQVYERSGPHKLLMRWRPTAG